MPLPRPPTDSARPGVGDERGQAGILLVAVLLAVLVGAFVLGGIARGVGAQAGQQRAADLAALAGAKAMHSAYPRLFERERGITVAAYRALAERVARDVAERNGADAVEVAFPDADAFAPVRLRVKVAREGEVRERRVRFEASADAELAPPATLGADLRGEYTGPLAHRDGKPMRTFRRWRLRTDRAATGAGRPNAARAQPLVGQSKGGATEVRS